LAGKIFTILPKKKKKDKILINLGKNVFFARIFPKKEKCSLLCQGKNNYTLHFIFLLSLDIEL
jgi:hypothetical protein